MVTAMVIILVFSSGCIENREEMDLFAAKFSGDGTLVWVQVIDTGRNDEGTALNETPDGGYLITGGSYPSRCNDYRRYRDQMQPYEVRLSPTGRIESVVNTSAGTGSWDDPTQSSDRNGTFRLAANNGDLLSTYPVIRSDAVSYRLKKTDAGENVLWDKPFLTLKGHPAGRHLTGETILVQGIVMTHDGGYLIWGAREKVTPC